jgi:hypothetical protein
MDELEFQALRVKYWTAFTAYEALAAKNAARRDASEPSAEQLKEEQQALDALAAARHDLLEALGNIQPRIH